MWSHPIPSDPVAIHTADTKIREHVVNALTAIAKPNDADSEGNKAVMAFWSTSEGFDKIDPNAYAFLLGPMKSLGLRPADVLRKL